MCARYVLNAGSRVVVVVVVSGATRPLDDVLCRLSLGAESDAERDVVGVRVGKVPLELEGRGVPDWCGGKTKQTNPVGRSNAADRVPG